MNFRLRILLFLLLLGGGAVQAQFGYAWAYDLKNKLPQGAYCDLKDVYVDIANNTYVTGSFRGFVDFDPGPGVYNLNSDTYTSNGSIYFAKYDPNGQLVFAKQIYAYISAVGNSITADSLQNIYVCGAFNQNIDFDPGPGTATEMGAYQGNIYYAKYDPQGNYLYHRAILGNAGLTAGASANDILLDHQNNVVIAGNFASTMDFDPGPGVANLTASGTPNAYFAKFDNAGGFLFAKALVGTSGTPSTNSCSNAGLAVDAVNNIYISGGFESTVDFNPDAGTTVLNGGVSALYFAKYTSNGAYVFAKHITNSSAAYVYANAIAIDANLNIGITGSYYCSSVSLDFDPGPGTAYLTSTTASDTYFAKYDNNGNYLWAKHLTGSGGGEEGHDLAFDAAGNMYLAGMFDNQIDFDPNGGVANLGSTNWDREPFLAKYDPSGAYLFAKHLQGSTTQFDVAQALALNSLGEPHVGGSYSVTIDMDPSPSAQVNLANYDNTSAFVGRYDASGNYIWADGLISYPSPSRNDEGLDIARDAAGNVYVTGYFTDTVDFDPGPGFQYRATMGGDDAFLAKYDAAGNYVYVVTMGSTGSDTGNAVVVDPSGNAYVTGSFNGSVDFDPSAGTTTLTSAGSHDIYLAKYGPTGNLVFAGRMGGTQSDQGNGIGLDASNNIYLTGFYRGGVDFDHTVGVANLNSSGGSQDIFLSKYTSTGAFVFAKGMVGTSSDAGHALTVDASGNCYLTGIFQGTVDFDPSGGTANLVCAGLEDVFVAKYNASGLYQYAGRLGSVNLEESFGIACDVNGNAYVTGYFLVSGDYDPSASTYTLTSSGQKDGFLVKLNSTGGLVYAINMGGLGNDIPLGVVAEAGGNCYVTGSFSGLCDFGPTGGTQNLTANGGTDIFLCKYDPAGNYLEGANMGGRENERGTKVAISPDNRLLITGSIIGGGDYDPGVNYVELRTNNGKGALIAKYQDCLISIAPTTPTLAATNLTSCSGDTVTLTVQSGSLNDATEWKWYTGSCGGTFVGTGTSIAVHPTVNTTYYVRGEGVCFLNETCSSITINVQTCLSGTILHPNGLNPIRYSTVALTGPTTSSVVTGTNGKYLFPGLTTGGNYTVTPSKANDTVTNNGISTLDLVLMQQHILNQSLLNSPYKILAGDVNLSGGVTTLDIVLTRTVILQTSLTFPSGRLWTMVDASYVFPNAQAPWPFPSTRNYPSLSTQSNQDFYGIKLGDVNWSWNPSVSKMEPVGELPVYFGESVTGADGIVKVPVLVKDCDAIAGYQFTLTWDPLLLGYVGVEKGATAAFVGEVGTSQGSLTVSWNDPQGDFLTLPDGSVLFFVEFKHVGIQHVTATVKLNSSIVSGEAYDRNLNLLLIDDAQKSIEFKPSGLQCFPNPFSGTTTFRFQLSKAGKVEFVVSDLSGKVVAHIGGAYSSGMHDMIWDGRGDQGRSLNAGCYFVRMGSEVVKVVKTE